MIVLACGLYLLSGSKSTVETKGKTLAVLPFINDSPDSSNVYIINGLMDAIINDLQKIEDLKVISRTSVEAYRNNTLTIPKIASELGVRYIVEGSGQKQGDALLFNIRLIDAQEDAHLWSGQFNRSEKELFTIQAEIGQHIAQSIQIVINPEVEHRLNRPPTSEAEAYEAYLMGLEFLSQHSQEGLLRAIPFFNDAIAIDAEFALAYAQLALAYYFLDLGKYEKSYLDSLRQCADQAMLYDPELSQSLVAKALVLEYEGNMDLAEAHLLKAHMLQPHSPTVVSFLADFYSRLRPNTSQYLKYALKGIQLDVRLVDSSNTSFMYVHIANSLVQSGFQREALNYINTAYEYDPDNLYAAYVKAYIEYVDHRQLPVLQEQLISIYNKDTNNLDVLQEVAKSYYFLEDFDSALTFYRSFAEKRARSRMEVYPEVSAKIAFVYRQTGNLDEAADWTRKFNEFAVRDQTIYRDLNLCVAAMLEGDRKQAMSLLKSFSDQDAYHIWTILFLDIDPIFRELLEEPEFRQVYSKLEDKFWNRHQSIKKSLIRDQVL